MSDVRRETVFARHPVISGFVLVFLLTWPVEIGLAAQSHQMLPFHIPPILGPFVGIGFIVASIVVAALVAGAAGARRLLNRLRIWRFHWVWYAVAVLGPFGFYVLGIGVHVLIGGQAPDFGEPFVRQLLPPTMGLVAAGILFFLFQTVFNGEEFVWRGYAVPELQKRRTPLAAALVIGIVWAIWHVPKFLTAGDPHDTSFAFFAVNMIANAILYSWLFNRTGGSLLIVLIAHAATNTGIVILPVMPAAIDETRPLIIAYLLQNLAALIVIAVEGRALGRTSAA